MSSSANESFKTPSDSNQDDEPDEQLTQDKVKDSVLTIESLKNRDVASTTHQATKSEPIN